MAQRKSCSAKTTQTATNSATGASVTLMVVDMCGYENKPNGGIDTDPLGFNAIDTDGGGVRNGHMQVDLAWVPC